jgi:hypothetical protein
MSTMSIRIIACKAAVAGLVAIPNSALAAILGWGCQGQLGAQQVIFNRQSMVVVDTKQKMGDIRKLRMSKIELPPGSPPSVAYNPSEDDGLVKTMEFTRSDDPKRKVVFTERSSRTTSSTHRLICGRDEDIVIYRKVYRYQRENEPERNITMECMDYQLSTLAGRKGCGDD